MAEVSFISFVLLRPNQHSHAHCCMASNMLTMEDGHELPTEAQRPVDRDGGGGLEAGGGGGERGREGREQ